MAAWREIPVFIHGMTPDRYPEPHLPEQEAFLARLEGELRRLGRRGFTEDAVHVEWGWGSPGLDGGDHRLSLVQRVLEERIAQEESRHRDLTLNPLRLLHSALRRRVVLGFSDLFYYVSEQGGRAIRESVFSQVCGAIGCGAGKGGPGWSLTLLAHSAGCLIAHDLLLTLFTGRGDPTERRLLARMRELVEAGRLRIRRLYTVGSPLTPLVVRSRRAMDRICAGRTLSPGQLGLLPDDELEGPRWLNFWDKDDVVAYPISFLYDRPDIVQDRYVDLGDLFPAVHERYWRHPQVVRLVAESW